MSSTDNVHKVLIVPECIFVRFGSEITPKLLAGIEQDLEATKSDKESQKKIIFATSAKNSQGLPIEVTALSEKIGVPMQLLCGFNTFEEALLVSKKSIDELNCSEITVIVPQLQFEFCQKVGQLVFNEMAYSVNFIKLDVGVDTAEQTSQSEEEISNSVAKIISTLPPVDLLLTITLKSPLIPGEFFYHGYTKRTGGVSTYPTMQSLNLAFSPRKKDTWLHVKENRRRLAQAAGFEYQHFKMPKVVHGIDVWVIGDDPPDTFDAMVTDQPGITLAAPGADCQTLLFCDPEKKVIGAAHSGWKGTVDRVQQNVVRVMKERFKCDPKDILVSIGPSIGSCCYNVTKERAQQFIDGVAQSTVVWKDGVPFLDLWQTSTILLQEVGIKRENIDDGNRFTDAELAGQEKVTQCTHCNPEKFFSYRRDGAIFGNQIGFIGIKKRLDKSSY